MSALAGRVARLEQAGGGDEGAGVLGFRTLDYRTGDGPDAVAVPSTGETVTQEEFARRFPRGLVFALIDYSAAA